MTATRPAQGDEPRAASAVSAVSAMSPREPVLFNLVYCSRAAKGVDQAAVEQMVATARRKNAEHGITGMLVFGAGVFFQWLEGPRANVLQLMSLIQADARHHDVIELSVVEEVRERLFPDWDMELVGAEHIREVLVDAHGSVTEAPNQVALARLLADLESGQLAALRA